MPRASRRVCLKWLVPVLLLGFLCAPAIGWSATKLFLKDGSYQLVKSYEVHGDRVRYYSLERSQWEELPLSLVDFEATQHAEQQDAAQAKKNLEEAREIEKERFEKSPETGFEVAPGIHLPLEEGVFAFDGVRVIRMIQSSANVVTDKKRRALSLALPGPLLKNRAWVILPGAKAAVRILAGQPAFYVHSSDGMGASLELIPVRTNKEARWIEKIQTGIGVGKSGEVRDALPLERTQIAPGLFRLKPVQSLELGEYALGELTAEQKLNLELWDFGIDGTGESRGPAGDTPPTIRRSPSQPPN